MADWYFRNKQNNNLQVCPGCRNLVRKGEEFCPFCAMRLRARGGLQGLTQKLFSRPDSVTRLIIGVLIGFFLLQLAAELMIPAEYRNSGGGGLFSFLAVSDITYILMGSNFQPLVHTNGEYWRWMTYCFLHIGLIHILFNCWAFRDLGRMAERLWGGKQLFATFVLTGFVAGAASYVWAALILGQARNSAGASGAICGVLGLVLGSYYKNRYHIGSQIGPQFVQWAVYILVFGLIAGADNGAHVGGMIAGGVLGYFLPPTNSTKTRDRDRKVWNTLAWISVGILVICIGFGIFFAAHGPEYAYKISRLALVLFHR